MKKLLFWLMVVCLVALAAVWFGRDIVARKSIEAGVTQATGFPLSIGALKLDLAAHRVDVRDMELKNPAGFEEPLFVEMPQLLVDYDLGSMLGEVRHLHELVVDIKQLKVVKDKQGQSNVAQLKGVLGSSGGEPSKYRIDKFHLKVGTVTIKEYAGEKMTERKYAANLDVTFKDLTDKTDLNRLVLATVLSKVRLPDIGGLSLATLTEGITGTVLGSAGEVLKGTTEAATSIISGSTNVLQKTGKTLFRSLEKLTK